jgi:hypothetical protein
LTATAIETIIKYPAPKLVGPVDDAAFTPNEEVRLQWIPVGELTDVEQYAVRLRFFENEQFKIDGHQVKTTEWIIPPEFQSRVDGPTFKFEWYVFVERVENSGINTQISPDSEIRVFYWR